MRRAIFVGLGFVLGTAAVAGAGLMLAEVARIAQAEGAYMMRLFLVWAPLGGCVGAVTGWLAAR